MAKTGASHIVHGSSDCWHSLSVSPMVADLTRGFSLCMAWLGAAFLVGCSIADEVDQPEASPVPTILAVRAEAHEPGIVIETAGTVAFRREMQLGFTTGGRIGYVRVQEGQNVPAGQALAGLDATVVQAELTQALAERNRATETFLRTRSLANEGWVTRASLETAEAALLAANARVDAAQFQTSSATIHAPSPGVVLARLAEPGQVVVAGHPIIAYGDRSSGIVVRGPVNSSNAARIEIGSRAEVITSSMAPRSLPGRVIEIGGKADESTGTFLVEVSLPPDANLRSGQVVTIRIYPPPSDQVSASVSIPLAALFSARGGEGFVFLYNPRTQKVHHRKVVLGALSDASIEIRDGLQRGDIVAVSKIDELSAGQSVRLHLAKES